MQEYIRRYFLVKKQTTAAFVNDVCTHGIRIICLLFLGLTATIVVATALWIIAVAAAFGVVVSFAQRQEETIPTHAEPGSAAVVEEHWAFGKWLVANNMAYWCGAQFTLYLGASLLSVGTVGGMMAALSLMGVTNIVFLWLESLVPQRASSLYRSHGAQALHRYLKRIALSGGLIISTFAVVAGAWNQQWMELLYGPLYQQYGWLVWWWGLYHVIGFFHRPFSAGLRVLGDTKAIYRSGLAGAIAAIVLSYPAMQLYGTVGAMLAICLTQTTVLVNLFFSYRRAIGATIHQTVPMRGELAETSPAC
jgi:O-antigen/teichoic acid export membrane protein